MYMKLVVTMKYDTKVQGKAKEAQSIPNKDSDSDLSSHLVRKRQLHSVNFCTMLINGQIHPILSPHSKFDSNTIFFLFLKTMIKLVIFYDFLTSYPTPPGSSMSSKTPGRDLEDMVSLDGVFVVGSA